MSYYVIFYKSFVLLLWNKFLKYARLCMSYCSLSFYLVLSQHSYYAIGHKVDQMQGFKVFAPAPGVKSHL